MTRHPVPGGKHWFDLKPLDDLNTDHQKEYRALLLKLREARQETARAELMAAHPGMVPDPEQDIPVRLTPEDVDRLRDLLLSWILADSSFGLPLTWPLPLVAGNVLARELDRYYTVINGGVPEDPTQEDGGTTSATTSQETAAASQPEPTPETSATPGGS